MLRPYGGYNMHLVIHARPAADAFLSCLKSFSWGVAKLARHGTLAPAYAGSSPAAPASFAVRINPSR